MIKAVVFDDLYRGSARMDQHVLVAFTEKYPYFISSNDSDIKKNITRAYEQSNTSVDAELLLNSSQFVQNSG